MELYEKSAQLPYSLWSEKLLSPLSPKEERTLWSHESGLYGVQVKPYTIQNPGSGPASLQTNGLGRIGLLVYTMVLFYTKVWNENQTENVMERV